MTRILVAEDDPAIQKLLCTLLSRYGFQVECANDGAEALRRLRAEEFAAVLLDLMMPNVSGWAVIEELRRERPEILTRLVVLTAASDKDLTGLPSFLRVMRKPFDIAQLVKALRAITTNPAAFAPMHMPEGTGAMA